MSNTRYYCRDCDYVGDSLDLAEDHESEWGHSVREVEVHPVAEE